MSDLKNIKEKYSTKLNNDLSLEEINQIKTELFGKNGIISSQFKNIGSIPETDRKKFASDLNQIKDNLQNLITEKINEFESKYDELLRKNDDYKLTKKYDWNFIQKQYLKVFCSLTSCQNR